VVITHLAVGGSVIVRVGDLFVRIAEEGLDALPPDVEAALVAEVESAGG
jgi:hypothetical protein